MNLLEDRLREAMSVAARTVNDDAVPPLRLAQRGGRRVLPGFVRRRGRLHLSLLAAPAAAAAVVAIVLASVAVGASGHAGSQRGSLGSKLSSVPQFYMAIVPVGDLYAEPNVAHRAVIRDTWTGATLATIQPPKPFGTFVAVTAESNDRTFVLVAARIDAGDSRYRPIEGPAKLFAATFDPADGHVTLTALRIPEIALTTKFVPEIPKGYSDLVGLAVSPDGNGLAVALESRSDTEVDVYSLDNGTVKTWLGNENGQLVQYGTTELSWARDGILAFDWPCRGFGCRQPGNAIGLLNTNTSGGSLVKDSRLVVGTPDTYAGSGWTLGQDGFITTNGKTVVAGMVRGTSNVLVPAVNTEVREFSATTGKVVHVLWPSNAIEETVLWSNPSGTILVMKASPRSGTRYTTRQALGVLDGNRFIRIPNSPVPRNYVFEPELAF
jgi:hypothetical protein